MVDIQPFQIIIVICFLAALLAVQIFVKRFGRHGSLKLSGQPIQIVQSLSLGPKERLMLVRVREVDILVGQAKQGAITLLPLPDSSVSQESKDA